MALMTEAGCNLHGNLGGHTGSIFRLSFSMEKLLTARPPEQSSCGTGSR